MEEYKEKDARKIYKMGLNFHSPLICIIKVDWTLGEFHTPTTLVSLDTMTAPDACGKRKHFIKMQDRGSKVNVC